MPTVIFALLIASSPSVPPDFWQPPTLVEAVPMVPALALIWIDFFQARANVRNGGTELNPALGPHPSPGKLFWLGGVAPSLGLLAAWIIAPPGWRIIPPTLVAIGEGANDLGNAGVLP